jgi:hypothetical protein
MTVTAQTGGRFQIGKVLSDTFAVSGRNVGLWISLALIFSAIPAIVLQFLILRPLGGGLTNPEAIDPAALTPDALTATAWVGGLGGLITFVLALLLQAALIRGTIEDMSGKRPALGDCISTAISVLLPALGLAILVGLGVVIGLVLFIIPGIILFLRWCVAVPVLVQERQGVLASMGRSAVLTQGNRWALLGLFLVVMILLYIAQIVVLLVVGLAGGVIAVVLGTVVQSVLSTVFSTATAVSYVALREAKEGTSVQELAQIFA